MTLNSLSLDKEIEINEVKINETISAINTGNADEMLFQNMKQQSVLSAGLNQLLEAQVLQ